MRYKKCDCGIMVTASHNPPSDNAVKVYWSTGGQVVPPHDKAIVERVMKVGEIQTSRFSAGGRRAGKIVLCKEEIDAAFIQNVVSQGFAGPRDLKIIYSPLHGVGEFAAVPALDSRWLYRTSKSSRRTASRTATFPNVPGHVSNPENAGGLRCDHRARPRKPRPT